MGIEWLKGEILSVNSWKAVTNVSEANGVALSGSGETRNLLA